MQKIIDYLNKIDR